MAERGRVLVFSSDTNSVPASKAAIEEVGGKRNNKAQQGRRKPKIVRSSQADGAEVMPVGGFY